MDLAQSYLSGKCRDMIKKQIELMLAGEMTTVSDYTRNMVICWEEFKTFEIEDICKRQMIKRDNYEKKVIFADAVNGIAWNSRTLPQYRGAMFYNYWVDRLGLEQTYEPIMDGFICNYFDIFGNPFSFRLFEQPDFAPEPDKLLMFYKLIVNPVNRIAFCYDIVNPKLPIDNSYRMVPADDVMRDFLSRHQVIELEPELWVLESWLTDGRNYKAAAMPTDVAYRYLMRKASNVSDALDDLADAYAMLSDDDNEDDSDEE
jgi:hypothetical protein